MVRRTLCVLFSIGALLALMPALALADISVTEGQQFSGQVGTFTENCPPDPEPPAPGNPQVYDCSDMQPTATIDWGDATKSSATLTRKNPSGGACITSTTFTSCRFTVSGSHTYAGAGTYSASVSWSDGNNLTQTHSGSFTFNAKVSDAAISLSDVSLARSGQKATFSATLTDDNPDAGECDYAVTIEWGDGQSSTGEVNNDPCIIFSRRHLSVRAATTATFNVSGSHTYATEPSTDASVMVVDDHGGQTASATVGVPRPAQTTTEQATNVSQSSATLNAFVDPQSGTLSDCHFEWGTSTAYGHTAPCSPSTFTNPQAVTAALAGLQPGTTYHYQVLATTNVGTAQGGDQSFTTLAQVAPNAPTVITGGGSLITGTSATLGGLVNPNGHTVSDCHFEWGLTVAYGNTAPCVPANPSGSSGVGVSAGLVGLQPDTTYHFRLVATNPGFAPSAGADVSFATLPTCDVTAGFGYVSATGCLSHQGSKYKSTPGSTITLDGLTLTPDHPFTTITIDPSSSQVSTSGAVSVTAGNYTIYDGSFTWTEPDTTGKLSVPIGPVTPPPLTKVGGLPLQGDLALSFNNRKGADLTGNATLPWNDFLDGLPVVNGTITFHTGLGLGLLADQVQISRGSFSLLGVGVKNLKVTYDPDQDAWEGSADVSLPTPNQLDIGADLGFQHGQFQKFAGSADNLDFPVIDGIYLQRISVIFGENPTTIGGGLGLSFGPTVHGKQLIRVDGDFVYQAATASAAGFINVDGSLTLASFKVANAYFDYFTTGSVSFGAHAQLGLPDTSASDPSKQPVYIDAGLAGAVDGSHFDADVNATVALNFIDLTLGANVLVSDAGIAACATVSAFGFSWSPGAGYTWSTGDLDLMFTGCSVGPWQTLPLTPPSARDGARAAGSAGARALRVRVPRGQSLVELRGVTGAPKVTLRGPGGRHVSVPLASVKPLMVPGFMVFQDPAAKLTWIAVQHGGGQWTAALEPGSSAIARVRTASLLPKPRVAGSVIGKGLRRTLNWHAARVAGQRVVFWEKGRGLARVIGSSSAAHGSLRFTPSNANGRARTIVAQVFSYGHPRADITIARFSAPPLARPARPRHLRVTAVRGGAVRVSWSGAAYATQYLIEVDTNGARLVEFAGGRTHSIVVRDVVPIKAAVVKVSGTLADGVRGATAQTKFPAKTKPKPKKHHK